MLRHRFLWLVCIAVLSLPLSLRAQTTTGTVRGYVKDQNGTAAADAAVQARQIGTGVLRSASTRADGSYILPGLVPGEYELSIRKIGFSPQRRNVVVQIGATLLSDFTLQAGAVELQAVTVEGAPAVEMRTSEVATNVTRQQIEQLPTVNRNFLDLASLAPGVSVSEDRVNAIGFRTFSAGRASPNQSNVVVDGTSLKNDLTGGGVSGQDASRGNPFPRSAIQEYRVITQNFKAEYQKASSAILTATTRSGSNTWTGNVQFGFQDKGLVALDSFQVKDKHIADSIAAKNGTPSTFVKPDYTRSLPTFSVGGPIQKDRLFFFGSYEGNYQNRDNTVAFRPPSGIAALDTVNLTKYNGNFTSPFRESLGFGKLTYIIDPKSTVELSVNERHETDIRDFGNVNCSMCAYEEAVNFRQNVTIAQLKYSRFAGSWLNETKVDYSRFQRNPSPNTPGLVSRLFHYPGQDARIGSNLSTQDFIQKRLGVRDDLTRQSGGQHVFKGGLSVDFVTYDIDKRNNETPQFEYAQYVDNNYGWTTDTTQTKFNFRNPYLLTYGTGIGFVSANNTQVGAYIQDDWSPTPRLTINLGIRWDFESRMLNTDYVTPKEVVDTLTRYNDSLATPLDLSRYISTGSNRKPYYGAFQPRIGFSYGVDPENKTTIFGRVGVYS